MIAVGVVEQQSRLFVLRGRTVSVHGHCSTLTHFTCLVGDIATLVSAQAGGAGAHNGVGEEEGRASVRHDTGGPAHKTLALGDPGSS
jgi:hypothetical protein